MRILTVNRANERLAINLGAMADEMRANAPNPAQEDAANAAIVDWVERYEHIVAKVQPEEERRNQQIWHAFTDANEAKMKTVEHMFKDWDKNDKFFWSQTVSAQEAMEQRLRDEGVVKDVEDLLHEVDATLKAMAETMYKIRRDTNSLTMAANTQSMGKVADHLRENLLTGAERKHAWDTVTGWVSDYEDIDAKMAPANAKFNAEVKAAEELREKSNIHVL